MILRPPGSTRTDTLFPYTTLFRSRFLGALLLLLVGLAATVLLGRQLVVPASEWVQQAPRELRLLTPRIKRMTEPVQQANEAAQTFAQATDGGGKSAKVQVEIGRAYV